MIRLIDFRLRYGDRLLFDGVNAQINPHDRIGLVGDNGTGKSTLLKILIGDDLLDSGTIDRAKYVTFGYLPQDGIVHSGASLYSEVETAFDNILTIQARIEEASVQLQSLNDNNDERYEILEVIGELEHRLDDLDAHKLKSKIEKVLFGLGFSKEDMVRSCKEFSGGWQMRIALAKLLLREPSLLLLDEPTNHLDLDSLRWLEAYLSGYDGAIMLVSHDRAFLDALCDRTFHLNQRKLDAYKGNYSHFEVERVKRREILLKAAENQRRERAHLQGFVDRFRAKASKASQAQSRMKKLEKMEVIEIDEEDSQIGFSFPPPKRSGQVVLKLEGISKAYGSLEVIKDLDLEIQRGDRIAVVGVNGAGKSTLTRIIAGVESFQSGERELGYQVELSYFAQNQADELDPNASVLDLGTEVAPPEVRTKVRNILGSFLFRGNDVFKKAKILSGGEKNRLALARMLMRPANFLVFDEPTNHLDMRSQGVLQEAIKAYAGTVVIVSHDRAFLDPLVNRVIEVRKDGVRCFPGNISDYIEKLKAEADVAGVPQKSTQDAPAQPSMETRNPRQRRQQEAERRRQLSETKKKAEALEKRAAELEGQVTTFEAAMADPDFFKQEDHPEQVRKYHLLKDDLEKTLSDWERAVAGMET